MFYNKNKGRILFRRKILLSAFLFAGAKAEAVDFLLKLPWKEYPIGIVFEPKKNISCLHQAVRNQNIDYVDI